MNAFCRFALILFVAVALLQWPRRARGIGTWVIALVGYASSGADTRALSAEIPTRLPDVGTVGCVAPTFATKRGTLTTKAPAGTYHVATGDPLETDVSKTLRASA